MFPKRTEARSQLALFLTSLRARIDPDVRVFGPYERRLQRVGNRVTQEELAEAIGVGREWYAKLESAPTTRGSAALIARLADALMVTPEERATLFQLAVPDQWRLHLRRDSVAVVEAFSRVRLMTKRLWTATSVDDILTTANEQVAGWFDDALEVREARRDDSGLWQCRSADEKQDRRKAAKAIAEIRRNVAQMTGSRDAIHVYSRSANAGDVGTPEIWPRLIQRESIKIYARYRVPGFAWCYARIRSRTDFIGGLYIGHEFGHSYSVSDRAVLGTLAEVASLALS